MKRLLFGYEDFLLESKLEMLLEAKIKFSDDFAKVLSQIASSGNDTADKLIGLADKDIEVNTNYIDISLEKDGFIEFIPDDKAEKLPWRIADFHQYYGYGTPLLYMSTSDKLAKGGKYPMKNVSNRLTPEQEVKIVKEFADIEDFLSLIADKDKTEAFLQSTQNIFDIGPIMHIQFEDSEGTHDVLCSKSILKRNISSIKPTELKVGKFATAMLTKSGIEFAPTEIEDFVTKYKSIIKQRKDQFDNLKIVKGEDIRKSYLIDNYLNTGGTLGNSCMRKEHCQKYLDIYVENEDKISLVVLQQEGKVAARALLWTDDKGRKVMDRIYTTNTPDEQLFKDFAKANNFYYKKSQDSHSFTPFISPAGEEEKFFTISLKRKDYSYYPYMDSMKFYNPGTGEITNDGPNQNDYNLEDTEGGNGECDICGGRHRITCGNCEGDGETDCVECGGSGENECSECGGEGEEECSVCDGEGKEECDYCDGHGESDCSTCDGEGTYDDEECSDCGGSGKESCEHCDGEGSRECSPCDGEGTRECHNCRGNGTEDCEYCENGRTTCWECDGDEVVDCPQCR